MQLKVNGKTGQMTVLSPKSKAGDYLIIKANVGLIIGMTACSAEMSDNYSFKPISYLINNDIIQELNYKSELPRQ